MNTFKLAIATLAVVAVTATSSFAAGRGAHQNDQPIAGTASYQTQATNGGNASPVAFPNAAANEDILLISRAAADARAQ